MFDRGNLFTALPQPAPQEFMQTLIQAGPVRIERIISRGHTTPEGQWFDQETAEWVVLLQGAASLRIENQGELLTMQPGDYIYLPAHLRHRVEWTDPEHDTIWLAIHYTSPGEKEAIHRDTR